MEEILNNTEYLIQLKVQDFINENPFLRTHREDLLQEARMMLVEKLPQYDKSKSSIETYVRNNTLYACYKYRREMAKTIIVGDGNMEELEDIPEEELRPLIEMVGLKDPLEIDIVERYIEGYTQAEIADMYNTYQQYVSRVIQKFRNKGLTNHNKYGIVYLQEVRK